MSFNIPNQGPQTIPPRHQPHQGNRGARKQQPSYQHRAQTSLMPHGPPPPQSYSKLPAPMGHHHHRVLLSGQQPQLAAAPLYLGATNTTGLIGTRPGIFSQPAANIIPQQFLLQQQQQPPVVYPTQQPIGLGQSTGMSVTQPMGMGGHVGNMGTGGIRMMQANPPVMYNQQDQPEVTPNANSRPKMKSRSRAIKIVDPNTNTEVKVDEPSPGPVNPETVAEFKNKVQSAVGEVTPPVGGSDVVDGPASQHRPNAIITQPDPSPSAKVEEGVAPVQVEAVVGEQEKAADVVEGAKVVEQGGGASQDGKGDSEKSDSVVEPTPVNIVSVVGEESSSSKEVEPTPAVATPTPSPAPQEEVQMEDQSLGTQSGGGEVQAEQAAGSSEDVERPSQESGQPEEVTEVKEKEDSQLVPDPEVVPSEATPSEGAGTGKEEEEEESSKQPEAVEKKEVDTVDKSDVTPTPPPEADRDIARKEEESRVIRDNSPKTSDSALPVTSTADSVANHVEAKVDSAVEFCTIPVEPEPTAEQELEPTTKKAEPVISNTSDTPPAKTVDREPVETPPTNAVSTNSVVDKTKPADQNKTKGGKASPLKLGPDGRMMYDRDFLMQFKDMPACNEKPAQLLKDIGDIYHDGSSVSRSYQNMGGGGGGGFKNDRRPSSRRGSEPKRIIHQPIIHEKVELRKAEVRWIRPTERSGETSEEAEELYRKFQGILNKLTPQKFQSLAEQALKLEISTEDRLSGCIDKIFTKALEEPSFSIAYANLCKVMSPIKVEVAVEDGKTKSTNFRRMLLTKCQQEFEKDKQDDKTLEEMRDRITQAETDEKRQELKKELSIAVTRMRKRSLGNIRFIGELFKLKMLSETIMHECITRLLKSTSDEESLECFGKLIMTTGKDLDKPEAKTRIDAYFKRIGDIIKKGKIPARIKFMLQDVQELRNNNWVPRVRQDKQLKTIDQIRAEAKMEEEKEKEMIQQHQVSNYRMGGGRDNRRGSKADVDSRDRRDNREREREKVDHTKLFGMLSKRKDKSTVTQPLAPTGLRPGGWKKNSVPATSPTPPETVKSSKPSRSSSSGSKRVSEGRGPGGKGSGSGPKRSHTIPTPEQEKEATLQMASQFFGNTPTPSKDAPAHAVLRQERKPAPPVPVVDEALVSRKVTSIIDELVNNADLKEAMECVKELAKDMEATNLMSLVVTEGIKHALERRTEFRLSTGKLFSKLVQEKILTQQKFLAGLNEVLEVAEDYSIDIPKFWDYLGEVLAPVMAHSTLSLALLGDVPQPLVESGMAARLVAKVLQQCQKVLGTEEAVKALWSQSRLNWESLGKGEEDLAEFLVDQNLGYLRVVVPETEPVYLKELQQQLSSDRSNEEVADWIKANCTDVNSKFMRHLTTAIVYATVTGSGTSAIFTSSLFEKRMELVKMYSDNSEEQCLQVLYALQVAVTKLSHPPKLLNDMFNLAYDTEVLGEDDFFEWERNGSELYGRGNAIMSVKIFFEWLKSDSEDTQNAT